MSRKISLDCLVFAASSNETEPRRRGVWRWLGIGVLSVAVLALFAPASWAQTVTVSVDVAGTAVPGGILEATATVDIQDGSTLQSINWTQTGGAAASINPTTGETVTVTLAAESLYKDELIHVLSEPPIGPEDLPPNVIVPPGEFSGGLQDRFQVVAVNPFALEEGGKVTLKAEVTTTSGMYEGEAEVHTELPWKVKPELPNVGTGLPVLLHGRDQDSYDWVLKTRPWLSNATLQDATSQNPEFTPDARGKYTVTVTDITDSEEPVTVVLDIFAGTWQGAITGQDGDGRPLATNCTPCHVDGGRAPDYFTDWAQTGHAEIFTDLLNTNTHYGESCFPCHTVGFDLNVFNIGFDDVGDYQGFLESGLINNPGDNWTKMLEDFPQNAQFANIQCENCHGPQSGGGHVQRNPQPGVTGLNPRVDISSNTCATCHGEPLRHARFQQWQLSRHSSYELAIEEGQSGNCSRCHTGNGFLTWLPVLLDDDPGTDPTASIEVNWTEDKTHPQTCATCHDPHNIGTTSGNNPNATVRISDETPLLTAGFVAPATPEERNVGRGAICITCHNTRRGLRNDNVPLTDPTRAPHGGAQGDLLMGQNAYLVDLGPNDPELGYPPGLPGSHANTKEAFPEERNLVDTCATCHMEKTPPPPVLSYNLGGTNHTFFASTEICSECHTFSADDVQGQVAPKFAALKDGIEAAILAIMAQQIDAGNSIDLNGDATITDVADIEEIEFGETRGRQAITVTFTDDTTVGPVGLNSVDVINGDGDVLGELYDFADEKLPKAGWNWNLINNDGTLGVHNFFFVRDVLDASIAAVEPLAGP